MDVDLRAVAAVLHIEHIILVESLLELQTRECTSLSHAYRVAHCESIAFSALHVAHATKSVSAWLPWLDFICARFYDAHAFYHRLVVYVYRTMISYLQP